VLPRDPDYDELYRSRILYVTNTIGEAVAGLAGAVARKDQFLRSLESEPGQQS
jgi:hypothetical protein